ncbi:phosphotransferase [Acrocarpospora corrugata]|uniref:phosphotransferase n=1 Tax=Acrocarpospora corrugata TaxID=35763 RepID=UPI001C3FE031|nr:phosphotransferase [Acrocarpospora corrugata]
MALEHPELPAFELAEHDLIQVAKVFSLGSVGGATFLPSGMMNRNWRVSTGAGVMAIKEIIDVPVPKARRSLTVVRQLADAGLPVCAPRVAASGDVVAEIDGRGFCVLPWAEGSHLPGTELTVNESTDLGALVGRFHQALAAPGIGLDPVANRLRAKVTPANAALAEADRFLQIIATREELDAFDAATLKALRQRKELLTEWAGEAPPDDLASGPVGWTHGDLQPLNLLWRDGAVVAVLDWDRLGVRAYGEEVVRTAQVQFTTDDGRLDLERVVTFAAGYRSQVRIADEDLVDAVERLWWKRLTDFWQLQWHYDKGDHGPDRLWESGERLLHWWTARRDLVRAVFTSR